MDSFSLIVMQELHMRYGIQCCKLNFAYKINMNYVYPSRLITRIHLLKKDFETSYRSAFIKLAFAFTGF